MKDTAMNRTELFNLCMNCPWKQAGNKTTYKIAVDDSSVYLCFEGSNGDEDWKTNFRFWVKPYKRQAIEWYAHAGFVKAWKLSRDQILDDVRTALIGNSKSLVVTGFSHGAAIALLAHEDLTYVGLSPETVTFGSPRVLWLPSHALIEKRFKKFSSVMTNGDLVTHIPFALFGYRHVNSQRIGKPSFLSVKQHYPEAYLSSL